MLDYVVENVQCIKFVWRRRWPGAPDGMFPDSSGFITYIHPVKSSCKVFAEGLAKSGSSLSKLSVYHIKVDNQICNCATLATCHHPVATHNAMWCFTDVLPNRVRSKEETCGPARKAISDTDKTVTIASSSTVFHSRLERLLLIHPTSLSVNEADWLCIPLNFRRANENLVY